MRCGFRKFFKIVSSRGHGSCPDSQDYRQGGVLWTSECLRGSRRCGGVGFELGTRRDVDGLCRAIFTTTDDSFRITERANGDERRVQFRNPFTERRRLLPAAGWDHLRYTLEYEQYVFCSLH